MSRRVAIKHEPRCQFCDGSGWRWVLPEGCNPFTMKLPAIIARSTKVRCRCQSSRLNLTETRGGREG